MGQSLMESSSQTTVCFSHPNRTLVIMAKAPKAGMVKTRLTESLPLPAVTALYRCLLEDTLALATSLTSVEVAVMCPESDQDELAHLVRNTVQVVAQKGAGLAAGLTSVFRHFTSAGRQHVRDGGASDRAQAVVGDGDGVGVFGPRHGSRAAVVLSDGQVSRKVVGVDHLDQSLLG